MKERKETFFCAKKFRRFGYLSIGHETDRTGTGIGRDIERRRSLALEEGTKECA
jgi:hypothetical protein